MTTAQDICISALKKAGITGVGQAASALDINDAFLDLQDMLAQWQRQRWLIWTLTDTAFTANGSGTGASPFTVGIGGNFNVARPDRIEAAYFRQLITAGNNPVDYPLDLLESYEDYATMIALKSLVAFPTFVCYRPDYPTGKLFVYPAPTANIYEIHILTKSLLNQFVSLTDSVLMPPEYTAALKWNLTVRLIASYDLPDRPTIVTLAKEALNVQAFTIFGQIGPTNSWAG
jgi:hypothetical protein